MSDPERLMNRGATSFEERLLRAGRGDAMSERSRRVIASSLGVGSMLWAGGLAAAVQKAGKGWLASSALRWGGVALLSGAALWAGIAAWKQPAEQPVPPPVVTPKFNPAPALSEPANEPQLAEPTPVSEEPGKEVAPRRAHSAALDKRTLADELAAVELARRALARKDPAQCLRLLDEYSRRFSPRRLDAEAIMLRIEALSASGDRATAQRLGQSFLAKHPQGPYARRVRSLIGLTPEP
jgi:hypothetical protein